MPRCLIFDDEYWLYEKELNECLSPYSEMIGTPVYINDDKIYAWIQDQHQFDLIVWDICMEKITICPEAIEKCEIISKRAFKPDEALGYCWYLSLPADIQKKAAIMITAYQVQDDIARKIRKAHPSLIYQARIGEGAIQNLAKKIVTYLGII